MTRMTLAGKLLGAGLLVTACLLMTTATAFSQAQPQPQKKVQIKILIDGKEIDLGDLQLHLDAKKKPEAGKDPVKPVIGLPGIQKKEIINTGDGKITVTSDGKTITVVDANTGKIIARHEHGDAKTIEHIYKLVQPPQADPRIEELVKAAEKIKPGSGAEVRKALQGQKPAFSNAPMIELHRAIEALHGKTKTTTATGTHVGKKIIIVIEDGKVQQIHEQDLKKLIEKGVHFRLERKDVEKKVEVRPLTVPASPKAVVVPPIAPVAPVPPAAADVEALRRQLERLSAELQDLRKRLEAGKK